MPMTSFNTHANAADHARASKKSHFATFESSSLVKSEFVLCDDDDGLNWLNCILGLFAIAFPLVPFRDCVLCICLGTKIVHFAF